MQKFLQEGKQYSKEITSDIPLWINIIKSDLSTKNAQNTTQLDDASRVKLDQAIDQKNYFEIITLGNQYKVSLDQCHRLLEIIVEATSQKQNSYLPFLRRMVFRKAKELIKHEGFEPLANKDFIIALIRAVNPIFYQEAFDEEIQTPVWEIWLSILNHQSIDLKNANVQQHFMVWACEAAVELTQSFFQNSSKDIEKASKIAKKWKIPSNLLFQSAEFLALKIQAFYQDPNPKKDSKMTQGIRAFIITLMQWGRAHMWDGNIGACERSLLKKASELIQDSDLNLVPQETKAKLKKNLSEIQTSLPLNKEEKEVLASAIKML